MPDEDSLNVHAGYRHSRTPTAKMGLAQWAQRVAGLPDLAASRELAGLSDEQLSALALQFERTPQCKRTDLLRFSFPVSALLALMGAGFALAEAVAPINASGLSPLVVSAAAFFGAAFIALCAGTLMQIHLVPTEAAHRKAGLLVSVLNEQHPWLYDAYVVIRNPAALAYRETILRERGPVRGMDFLLMRQIAELQENMELMHNARAVAASVQGASEVLDPAAANPLPPVLHLAPSAAVASVQSPAAGSGKVLTLGSPSEAA